MSGPTRFERAWRRLKSPVDLLVCLVALKILTTPGGAQAASAGWTAAMHAVSAAWAVLWVLELWTEWRLQRSPLRSSIHEIYQGYRHGDPRFRRGGAAGTLSLLAAILLVAALHKMP